MWDHDFADESNNFLGEVLIELSTTVLNNQPFLYPLIDMDEENPIRTVCATTNFFTESFKIKALLLAIAAKAIQLFNTTNECTKPFIF